MKEVVRTSASTFDENVRRKTVPDVRASSACVRRIASGFRLPDSKIPALYAYYQRTASMLKLVHRDLDEVEALKGSAQGFQSYLGCRP